jgi:hypothetical protein
MLEIQLILLLIVLLALSLRAKYQLGEHHA